MKQFPVVLMTFWLPVLVDVRMTDAATVGRDQRVTYMGLRMAIQAVFHRHL